MAQVKPHVLEALQEHIKVAHDAVSRGEYQRLVIQANRAITDATLWESIPSLVIPGLILRMAAVQVGEYARDDRMEFPLKDSLLRLISVVSEFFDRPTGESMGLWKSYEDFIREFAKNLRPKYEGKSYTDNPAIVDQAIVWSRSVLQNWWSLVGDPTGSPFQGVVNEVTRLIKSHGATSEQLAWFGLLQALEWWSQYASWQSMDEGQKVDKTKLERLLRPYVERLVALSSLSGSEFYGSADELAFDLLKAWRTDFVKYYDLYLATEARGPALVPVLARRTEKTGRDAKSRGREKE